MAELKQLFDSVEAKQYKRPDMNGDLRLDDFAGTHHPMERNGDGALDYSHLTSALWGVWTRWKPGRRSGGRRTSRCEQASRHPGNLAQALFWGNRPPGIQKLNGTRGSCTDSHGSATST